MNPFLREATASPPRTGTRLVAYFCGEWNHWKLCSVALHANRSSSAGQVYEEPRAGDTIAAELVLRGRFSVIWA